MVTNRDVWNPGAPAKETAVATDRGVWNPVALPQELQWLHIVAPGILGPLRRLTWGGWAVGRVSVFPSYSLRPPSRPAGRAQPRRPLSPHISRPPSERALDGAHPLHAQPLQAHPVSSSPGGIRAAPVAAPKQPMDPAPAHEEVDAMTSFSRPRAAPVEAAQTVAVERDRTCRRTRHMRGRSEVGFERLVSQ